MSSSPSSSSSSSDLELLLRSRPFRLSSIEVTGNSRTKTDFLLGEFRELQQTPQTFGSVLDSLQVAEQRIRSYRIFDSCQFELDSSPESPNSGVLRLHVQEKKMAFGGQIAANRTSHGESELELNVMIRNAFGRAERVELRSNYGQADSQAFSLTYSKPRMFNQKNLSSAFSIFNSAQNFSSFASFQDRGRGVNYSLSHSNGAEVTIESAWRDLLPTQRTLSAAEKQLVESGAPNAYPGPSIHVLENAKPSVKNSLKYSYSVNRLDHPIIPTRGTFMQLCGEYAGFGGDAQFTKVQADAKAVFPISRSMSLSASILGGLIKPLNGQSSNYLSDRFYFGQPMTMRGFDANTVGPRTEADYVGGDLMASSTLALSFDLPSKPLTEIGARGHVFANAGNLVSLQSPVKGAENPSSFRSAVSNLWQTMRASVGFGLILPIQVFRLEINCVQPVKTQPTDTTRPFQLGVGLHFG